MITEKTYSLAEAALLITAVVPTSTRTLRRLVADKKVEGYRVGNSPRGALRFTERDVEAAIAARLTRITHEPPIGSGLAA